MTQNGKLMPNLDQESTKVLNLTVLRRIDPFVEEILTTAAHVTFYEFNIEHSRWSRKDVEGSLFVVKRNTQPRFQFIVMNRRNTDNLVENLLGDFEYEVQGPYLLYKNAAQEVNGIWFYNARECEEVANLFNRILNAYSKVPPKPKVSSSKSEFEELEAVPTKNVLEGPLEPLPSSTSTIADVPDDSFVNYFSMAINMGASSNSAVPLQPHPPASTLAPSSHSVATIPSPMPVPSVPSPPLPAASTPLVSVLDASDAITNRVTNLVKPSSFFGPASSSMLVMPTLTSSTPTAPPLQPPINLQRPYGSPILQPFPPPTPPPSLTANNGTIITREQVRDALMRLVQNNQFIDLLYRELLNAHYS